MCHSMLHYVIVYYIITYPIIVYHVIALYSTTYYIIYSSRSCGGDRDAAIQRLRHEGRLLLLALVLLCDKSIHIYI